MSSYSLLMKNKMELFQMDMQVITKEMNVLMKYLPEKDSVIQVQKERIKDQMEEVQTEIAKNQTSAEEREKLRVKLSELKKQVELLTLEATEKVDQLPVVQQAQMMPAANASFVKDTLLQAKESEINRLKATIIDLQAKQPSVIVDNKLAVYYFTTLSSDKKQRASRTKNLHLQFQLKGNMANLNDKHLYIEVRDPFHRIISSPNDKVRITNHFMAEYNFEPFNYQFVKGKYSVKIYSVEAQVQSITFLTLN
jgi:hypothetical protein